MAPDLRIVQPAQQLGDGRLAGAVLSDDSERRPGGNGEVEALQHLHAAGVGEGDIAKTNLARRYPVRQPVAGAQGAGGTHRRLQPQHRGDRGGRSVERPTESAEGDH